MSDDNLPKNSPDVSREPNTAYQVSRAVLAVCLAFNVVAGAVNVGRGHDEQAALQLACAVTFAAWLWIEPLVLARLVVRLRMAEARRDTARHQARMSAIACEAMEEQQRSGQLRVQVDAMTVN